MGMGHLCFIWSLWLAGHNLSKISFNTTNKTELQNLTGMVAGTYQNGEDAFEDVDK